MANISQLQIHCIPLAVSSEIEGNLAPDPSGTYPAARLLAGTGAYPSVARLLAGTGTYPGVARLLAGTGTYPGIARLLSSGLQTMITKTPTARV